MKKNKFNFVFNAMNLINRYWIIETVFTLLLLYTIFFLPLNIIYIMQSLLITIGLTLYRWLLISFMQDSYLEEYVNAYKHTRGKLFVFLNEKFLNSNRVLIKPIYYTLYYFPTNWFYFFVVWMVKKWWDIRLWINSNKDVIAQALFGFNVSYAKSPFSYKYSLFFRSYVIDVIFTLLYIPVYFKISLIAKGSWSIFFKYRLFGMIYAMVLIANNLHFLTWLRTTHVLTFHNKLILLGLLIYIFLFFLSNIVLFKALNDLNLVKQNMEKQQITNKYDESEFIIAGQKLTLLNLKKIVSTPNVAMYYQVGNYLLFLSLAESFKHFVDRHYNSYLLKTTLPSNIKMPSTIIKMGRISKYNFEDQHTNNIKDLFFLSNNSYVDVDESIKRHISKLNVCDMVWIFEKNYRPSFFMFAFSFDISNSLYDKLINYELYKTLYGNTIVQSCFAEQIQELEDLLFIGNIMVYMFESVFDAKMLLVSIAKSELNDIPTTIKSNNQYNQLLQLCDFLIYINTPMLIDLDYSAYFDKILFDKIKTIYKVIPQYQSYYGNDLKRFTEFWMRHGKFNTMDDFRNDPMMKMMVEIFSNRFPYVVNRLLIFKDKIHTYISKQHDKETLINNIRLLQEQHKQKYFSSQVKASKSPFFIESHTVFPEWKDFDKRNKKMFF